MTVLSKSGSGQVTRNVNKYSADPMVAEGKEGTHRVTLNARLARTLTYEKQKEQSPTGLRTPETKRCSPPREQDQKDGEASTATKSLIMLKQPIE